MKAWALRLLKVSLWVLMAPGLSYGQTAAGSTTAESLSSEQNLARLMNLKSQLKGQPSAEQIRFYAELFYQSKTPYLADPLGEAQFGGVSSRPLYRFDGFDCTTFVETVMALSLAQNATDFRSLINRIRYKAGQVSYFNRNHFPTVDWIPNNIHAGFVTDVTSLVAPAQESLTYIEKDNWYLKKGLRTFAERSQKTWARIDYIAKEDLLNEQIVQRIPSGAIFNVVRPAWNLRDETGTSMDVSHQGFVIHENGEVYMIHASNGRSRDGQDDSLRVKKDLLREYVQRVMMNSPTTGGMNFLSVRNITLERKSRSIR